MMLPKLAARQRCAFVLAANAQSLVTMRVLLYLNRFTIRYSTILPRLLAVDAKR
jgi:hypothetical protein